MCAVALQDIQRCSISYNDLLNTTGGLMCP